MFGVYQINVYSWILLIIIVTRSTESSPVFTNNNREAENEASYWNNLAQETLRKNMAYQVNMDKARNVIFFLGDGMGLPTIVASRIYQGQKKNQSGEEGYLHFENFPNVALSKTYNVDRQVSDSAGTATAYLTGVKGNYKTIGVTAAVKKEDCQASVKTENHVSSVLHWAQIAGKSTGFVTTTRVTHASPAGLYAHTAFRDWEDDTSMSEAKKKGCFAKDIALQLIEDTPGIDIQVILGGGRGAFLPKAGGTGGHNGTRSDGRDLVQSWMEQKKRDNLKHAYVSTAEQLKNINTKETDYLLGLFNTTHLTYALDKRSESEEPDLYTMVKTAIEILSRNPNGFFLFVEGGLIDVAHHDGFAHKSLEETVIMSSTIKMAQAMTKPEETLIIVTADHSHVMTINGYPVRGNNILGIAQMTGEPIPNMNFTTLMYTNGPGYRLYPPNGPGLNISGVDTTENNYKPLAAVPIPSETHGGEDVAVYAIGPRSHVFRGVIEQNYIPHAIGYAACIGSGADFCDKPHSSTSSTNGAPTSSVIAILTALLLLRIWT